jgi:hypothetical protein
VNGPKKRVWGFNHEYPVYPEDIGIYRGYTSTFLRFLAA